MWENCLLGRKEEAQKLEGYLERKQAELRKTPESRRGHTLNIDAKWGEGKTTFIECWHNQLSQNHLVIRFDAWKTDFFGDPLVAFVGTFDKQISDSKIPKKKKGLQKKIKRPVSIIKKCGAAHCGYRS